MHRAAIPFAILFAAKAAFAAEIREFNIPTLGKLGNELSHRDEIAARAEDVVVARYPQFQSVSPRWWITDLHKEADAVYLIDARKSEPVLAYKVVFPRNGSPQVQDMHHQPLPPQIAIRYKAHHTAMKAVYPKLNAAYGARYNFEVLNDPDGSGFLVYALAAFTKKDVVYIGGHFRITVSADGSKAERIDDLSRGIMENKADPGHEMVGIGTAQAVDTKYPVETFLYSSHLYRIPIGVATRDGTVWIVVNGKIEKMDSNAMKREAAEMAKKKK